MIKLVYYRRDGTFYQYRPDASAYITDSDVQIFTLGSSTWRSLGKARGRYFSNQSLSQALVNGRLHWVTLPDLRRMEIISFDLTDEQFREVPSTPLKGTYELVVLGGCLSAAVYLNSGTLEIWVMREYDVEESWIKKLNIRAHMPKGLEEDLTSQIFNNSRIRRHGGIWGHMSAWSWPRVLCLLKTGEILMEYESRVLVSYDPKSGEFKDLMFQGIPKWYRTIVHAGCLNWID
ncbi:F-box protein At3g07870-like [Juglans microcarpa x Juglans regia]|uniref:F-box protein At3g07870-like n=1 Tax=Juglans microcarpa x Juglans regia TaxID=2249226 RepID=UPI001B7E2590|nr:F-box protein At3g07870-like [Juglans microcarpa x Juglans regia]